MKGNKPVPPIFLTQTVHAVAAHLLHARNTKHCIVYMKQPSDGREALFRVRRFVDWFLLKCLTIMFGAPLSIVAVKINAETELFLIKNNRQNRKMKYLFYLSVNTFTCIFD